MGRKVSPVDPPEVVIVGAGVAGGALATTLARHHVRVLLLERSEIHRDRIRGEWMAPWGVAEAQELGILADLLAAGAHITTRQIPYAEDVQPEAARRRAIDLSAVLPGVPGALTFYHPAMCNALNEAAVNAGARMLRGITNLAVSPGDPPQVSFSLGEHRHTATPRLVVGADGRGSATARQIRANIRSDPDHHLLAGLLVEGLHDWPEAEQTSGIEGDVMFYVFPQGRGRVRLYIGYDMAQKKRFVGIEGIQNLLAAFDLPSLPYTASIRNAQPAGPCHSYPNADTWIDEPIAPGVVLIGDAAGYNDPTIGQGLSIALRDARLIRDIVLCDNAWTMNSFTPYVAERRERMSRLRFTARLVSAYREFTDEARARRRRAQERMAADASIGVPFQAYLKGPFNMPAEAFTKTAWDRIMS